MLWVAIILVGTSWPSITVGPPDLPLDKIVHFVAYAVLSALMLRATLSPTRWATLGAVVVTVATFGAVDEWHQSFIPGRSMSAADWAADTAGALTGAFAIRSLPFLTPRRPPLP